MARSSVSLSVEAEAGWVKICATYGVTRTAVVEAIGQLANEGEAFIGPDVIDLAQLITEQRKDRKPPAT